MKRSLVLHPFLFASSPILFSLANNMDQFEVRVSLVPLLVISALVLLCWSLVTFVLRNKVKAGLIVSLFLLLFFSYEHFYYEIRPFAVAGGLSRVSARTYLVCAWIMLFGVGTYLLVRTHRDLLNLTFVANVVSACVVTMSLIHIGVYEVRDRYVGAGSGLESVVRHLEDLDQPSSPPDIYYIILDGYASPSILEELYDYDNTSFLEYLADRGFYVAGESRSNYCQTALSLASSLNLQYLDGLVEQVGPDHRRRAPLGGLVHDNEVFAFLRQHGYLIVSFSSGWSITDIRSADRYVAPHWSPDEFQTMLIDTTPIPFVVDRMGGYGEYDLHRERILYAFDHLADFAQQDQPVFVFAHVMVPHPPFVFGPHGEAIDPDYRYTLHDADSLIRERGLTRDQYVEGYRNQLVFTNSKVESAVDAILARSAEPPIIILQSDHGPGALLDWEDLEHSYLKERMSILNAYHLADDGYAQLYPGITPVNSFRVIFNLYFGTDLELLGDESYFSTWSHPYTFMNVTDKVDAGAGWRSPLVTESSPILWSSSRFRSLHQPPLCTPAFGS